MKNKHPEEIKIYYSKLDSAFLIICGIVSIYVAFSYVFENAWFLGIVTTILSSLVIYIYFKRFFNNTPQIIINEKGIKLANKKIIYWGNIGHIEVRAETVRYTNYYLDIHAKNKNRLAEILVTIEVSGLDINPNKLQDILIKYRNKRRAILQYYEQ